MTLDSSIVTPEPERAAPAYLFVDWLTAKFDEAETANYGAFRLGGLTVVVARDSSSAAWDLEQWVKDWGGTIQVAKDGRAATTTDEDEDEDEEGAP